MAALSGPSRVLPEGKPGPVTALTSICYSTASGDGSPLHVVPAVTAMELLMAACELIDDIEDDEIEPPPDRRSLGSIIETTSTMIVLCHAALGKLMDTGLPASRVVRATRTMDSLIMDAMRGQVRDISLEGQNAVSLQDSYEASALKSASLVRCAAEVGACLGTDRDFEIELYGRFGWHLGLAMQLMNDISAVWPGSSGKSDLRLKKKTLPVAFALHMAPGSDPHADLVQRYYRGELQGDDLEDDVKEALWKCGAIHHAWAVAAREKAQARRIAIALSVGTQADCPLFRLLD